MKLASALNNHISKEFSEWLIKYIFPEDFLEDAYFPVNKVIYELDMNRYHSIVEVVIHNSKHAGFSAKELNDSISEACREARIKRKCYYFNVNVHDNIEREIESIGDYDLKENGGRPLSPIYSLLTDNPADQGGTSYAGLIGAKKEWMISFEYSNCIKIIAHGNEQFCSAVLRNLKKNL